MSWVWVIAIVLIFIIVIIVIVVIYNRVNQPTGIPLVNIGQPNPLAPIGPANPLQPVNPPSNRLVPIILPDNLPNQLFDCNFYGNKLNTVPVMTCPPGTDALSTLGGGFRDCYSRPCPPGYTRQSACSCVRL